MALTFTKLFAPQQLPNATGTIYTCPASPSTTVLKNGRVRLTNTTAGAVTATLYAVPSAGAAADSNAFMKAQSIPANSFVDVDLPTLAAGDTLQGLAGAATSITIHELGGVLYS
jgi:hypothetical protein